MRDDHRPKPELIHEVAGLRKQVVDLKNAMIARRRVEEALRAAEELLRTLIDGAPVGLALFRRDGSLVAANRPFARMLGYESAAELQRVGGVLGVFASPEEQSRMLGSGCGEPRGARFRHKSGDPSCLEVIGAGRPDSESAVLVVLDQSPRRPRLPVTGV